MAGRPQNRTIDQLLQGVLASSFIFEIFFEICLRFEDDYEGKYADN
jgi:hypothetical protein